MGEVLIAEYIKEKLYIQIFGYIIGENILFLSFKNNNTVEIYKLILWEGGPYRRIYIHKKKMFCFLQLGFLELEEKKMVFNLEKNLINDDFKYIIRVLITKFIIIN